MPTQAMLCLNSLNRRATEALTSDLGLLLELRDICRGIFGAHGTPGAPKSSSFKGRAPHSDYVSFLPPVGFFVTLPWESSRVSGGTLPGVGSKLVAHHASKEALADSSRLWQTLACQGHRCCHVVASTVGKPLCRCHFEKHGLLGCLPKLTTVWLSRDSCCRTSYVSHLGDSSPCLQTCSPVPFLAKNRSDLETRHQLEALSPRTEAIDARKSQLEAR